MLVKVCKHGNSLSVRLGSYITRTAHIRAGDMVDLFMLPSGEIRIKPRKSAVPVDADDLPTDSDKEQTPIEEQW